MLLLRVRLLSLSQELVLTVHFCSTATHTPATTEPLPTREYGFQVELFPEIVLQVMIAFFDYTPNIKQLALPITPVHCHLARKPHGWSILLPRLLEKQTVHRAKVYLYGLGSLPPPLLKEEFE